MNPWTIIGWTLVLVVIGCAVLVASMLILIFQDHRRIRRLVEERRTRVLDRPRRQGGPS